MKKLIIFLLLLCVGGSRARACNACGCATDNIYTGILSQMPGAFAGLQWTYRWYESHHDGTEAGKPPGHEYYQSAQLWGRYALSSRLQLFAFLPYQYNTKTEGTTHSTLSGIGDATVLLRMQLVKPKNGPVNWQHYLQVGVGIKAPTGAYNNSVLGSGDALAPSMQAGTGSWDGVANATYTVQHHSWGLNAEAVTTITTANRQDYKYGTRLGVNLQAFRQWNVAKGWRMLPTAGLRCDWAAADFDNYATRSHAQYTGGYMLYATAGLRTYTRHWGLELGYNAPAAQHYGDGLVHALGKTEVGLLYLF